MARFFKLLFTIFLTAPLFPSIASAKSNVEIVTEPPGAKVTIKNPKSFKLLGECITPCRLKFSTKKEFHMQIRKKGYKNSDVSRIAGTQTGEDLIFETKLLTYKEWRESGQSGSNPIEVEDDKNSNIQLIAPIPPQMPKGAKRGARCDILFDVTPLGDTTNIRTLFCTEDMFASASVAAVAQWKYIPRFENGVAVSAFGARKALTFRVADKSGRQVAQRGVGLFAPNANRKR